jgi:hypothetical protein
LDAIKVLAELLAALPINSMERQKVELLKTHVETMEGRIKLAEDRVAWATEKASKVEAENAELRAELAGLREQVAASLLNEEYEMRGHFAFQKGHNTPLCPNCKTALSQDKLRHECVKCKWHHEEVPTLQAGKIRLGR